MRTTLFSAGVVAGAKEAQAAQALIEFLASLAGAAAIAKSGMEPARAK